MRFSGQLPTTSSDAISEFTSVKGIGEMARSLEGAGFDAGYVTEHPFPPDDWLATGGHHAMDPFVALTAAAATTQTLGLHTNILVLPYRSPFITAKAVASLDVVSGGRAIVGVAAGYLEGEYRALGADFENRNDATDQAIVAMKAAWSGESVALEGSNFRVDGNTMRPTPIQRPHPPIWIGGNSKRAMRRAAEFAQGWSPFPLPAKFGKRTHTAAIENIEQLAARIVEMNEYAASIGRSEPLDVIFVPFGATMYAGETPDRDEFCEQLERLADIGVTWVSVGIPAESLAGYCEEAARFGTEVISRLRQGAP